MNNNIFGRLNNSQEKSLLTTKIWLFVPVVIYTIVFPFVTRLLLVNGMYMQMSWPFLIWGRVIARGISYGVLIYYVLMKDIWANLVYQIPYFVGYYLITMKTRGDVPSSEEYILGFSFLITTVGLFLLSKVFTNDSTKPLLLALCSFLIEHLLVNWIAHGRVYFIPSDISSIVEVFVLVITAQYLSMRRSV